MLIIIALIVAAYVVFVYGWGVLLIYIAIFVFGSILYHSVTKEEPAQKYKTPACSADDSPSDDDSFSTDDIIEIEMMEKFKDDFFD